jgi:peptide/nickel transport system substrate-binding protein
MEKLDLHTLFQGMREGDLTRRSFIRRAMAAGMTAAAANALAESAFAQDASPAASPSAGGSATTISREEYQAQVDAAFPFEEPASEGGQLIHVMTTDIQTLNTVNSSDVYSSWIHGFVFDTLIGTSVIDGLTVPGIADNWEISEDGITYTVHLHQNVSWHDGEPFTADDVIFTFDAALAEDSLSPRKGTIDEVLDSYRKIDDYTVEFTAKFQSAIFVNDVMGQFGIMPKHIWENVPPADWASDPGSTGQDPSRVVGTGAFKFVEWSLGDHVTLEKNPDYWDTPNIPIIDTYTYQVIADSSSAIASLQTGQADVIEVPFAQANPLRESNPELQIVDFDTLNFNYYFTLQDPDAGLPFTEVNVRQALQYALDRDLMAETVYDGFAIRGDGIYNVLSIAYDPDRINTIYTFDPEKAKSLLDDVGWVEGGDGIREKDGRRLSFEMFFSEGTATYETQVPYMQQAWREVGVEMLPSAIPFPTLSENGEAGNFEMILQGLQGTVVGDLSILFASDRVPPDGFNKMRYSNPEYDALVEPSKRELDMEKRIDLLIEQGNIVNDDAAVGINVFRKEINGASPRVHNFFPNGYSQVWWINRTWLES